MTTINQTTPLTAHKLLVFGPPKTGKTRNWCETCPAPAILFNTDIRGWESIVNRKFLVMSVEDFTKNLKDPSFVWPDLTVMDFSIVAGEISLDQYKTPTAVAFQSLGSAVNQLIRGPNPFATVLFDSYTTWDEIILDGILALNSKRIAEIQHYRLLNDKKWEFLQKSLSLKCNVVVLAHEEQIKNEMTSEVSIIPYGTGKIQAVIGMLFSHVLHTTTATAQNGDTIYQVETRPRGLVKGLGVRGVNVPAICKADWKEVFKT